MHIEQTEQLSWNYPDAYKTIWPCVRCKTEYQAILDPSTMKLV